MPEFSFFTSPSLVVSSDFHPVFASIHVESPSDRNSDPNLPGSSYCCTTSDFHSIILANSDPDLPPSGMETSLDEVEICNVEHTSDADEERIKLLFTTGKPPWSDASISHPDTVRLMFQFA
ncbi:hypothetical protein L1887_36345 [Cichorium endivia]|nr:hypothetical protein L1887_36345 [Cichorium endivia]